jgi:hypothetical protein
MKTGKVRVVILMAVLALTASARWGGSPYELTGHYCWWDNQSSNPQGDVPPIYAANFPAPPNLPPVSIIDIHGLAGIQSFNKADEPFAWTLQDSFWYHGKWYKPGDKLYISPDGWVSFEQTTGASNPSTHFPFDDNVSGIIGVYWTNLTALAASPVNPNDDSTVYYKYYPESKQLVIEWFKCYQGANWFTFGLVMQFGGKVLIWEKPGCGVLWSGHFITYIYRNTSADWLTPTSWLVGIEDQSEALGLTIDSPTTTTHDLADDRIIRIAYGRVFHYNVEAYQILSPGKIVLRYTKIEPKVVVRNSGEETVSFPLTFQIDSIGGKTVYGPVNANVSYLGVDKMDTIEFPSWDMPGDSGAHYQATFAVKLDNDQCPSDDTLKQDIRVEEVGFGETKSELPKQFALSAIQPNPFATTAEIRYALPVTSRVSVKIYDIAGKLVKTVVDEVQESAFYTVGWDGVDDRGQKVGGGIYILKMETPGFHATKKFVLLR